MKKQKGYFWSKTILYHKIYRRWDLLLYTISKQRLTLEKKKSIQNCVLEIQSWAFLLRSTQLREMVENLLQAKGNYK